MIQATNDGLTRMLPTVYHEYGVEVIELLTTERRLASA